jgi:nucleotidyltransferase substrate binding protein (TIGR01987 family)
MMDTPDIRWVQRLQNYGKALARLRKAVALSHTRELTDLESQGLIQAFEFTHELAWNVMKDFSEYQGDDSVKGSRDATRAAFKMDLIADGEGWMDMLKSRNLTSHTYNEDVAEKIVQDIREQYFGLFEAFEQKMEQLRLETEQGTFFKGEL